MRLYEVEPRVFEQDLTKYLFVPEGEDVKQRFSRLWKEPGGNSRKEGFMPEEKVLG